MNFSFASPCSLYVDLLFFCIFNALFRPKHDCQDENEIKNLKWRSIHKFISRLSPLLPLAPPNLFDFLPRNRAISNRTHKSSILIIKETTFWYVLKIDLDKAFISDLLIQFNCWFNWCEMREENLMRSISWRNYKRRRRRRRTLF